MTVFERNLSVIRRTHPELAEAILKSPQGTVYKGIAAAKTGEPIPLFASGQALQSLYNPVREAERAFTVPIGFMLFCGLGSGVQLKVFLRDNPHGFCAVTEADYSAFKQLLSLIDYAELLFDERVVLLPPCTDTSFTDALTATYLPALHGTFGCHILRTWSEHFKRQTEGLSQRIEQALEKIKADFSVQAHFGKIWLRNIFLNLKCAAAMCPAYPEADSSRTALILGAGPSLEDGLRVAANNRQRYTLFCTDTALPAVCAHGLIPEFFVSLDPQQISYLHILGRIPKEIIGIFDLSGQAAVARRFLQNGNHIFFTAGGHPLAQAAAAFSPFPLLDTGSGTVAVAAYHAAQSLGFRRIECSGMDFAYTSGKAYARGTYLSTLYAVGALRIAPEEHSFAQLMFRTPVYCDCSKGVRTYRSALLDSYHAAFKAEQTRSIRWKSSDFKQFPYERFIEFLHRNLKNNDKQMLMSVLPALAWCKAHPNGNFPGMELVSELISGYTNLS